MKKNEVQNRNLYIVANGSVEVLAPCKRRDEKHIVIQNYEVFILLKKHIFIFLNSYFFLMKKKRNIKCLECMSLLQGNNMIMILSAKI